VNRAHVFPKPKPVSSTRWKLQGRCTECGYTGAFVRFRYTDGSVSSGRDCPSCGQSVQLAMSVTVS
jgi:ribosomal protein S27AE